MNIIEYVEQNNSSFSELPFGDVDSLILCQFFYAKIEDVLDGDGVSREAAGYELRDFFKAEYFSTMFNDGITDNENYQIFNAGIASKRYRNLKLKDLVSEYDSSDTKQFAAVCFELDDDTDYVCFRGTDGSMLGWKEDFELAFKTEAPSQADAVRYIEEHYGKGSSGENKKFYIGGHSKGGNLAIYAGLMCDASIHDRIIRIYSHDGPGFLEEVADRLRQVIEAGAPDIVREVPQSSIVGMLLHQLDDYCVVKSNASGIMQHAAFSWEIDGNNFVELEHITRGSEYFDRTVQSWLAAADDEHRENFINGLFRLLSENDIYTVNDLRELTPKSLLGIRKTFTEFDEETRTLMENMIKNLAKTAVKEMFPEGWTQDALTRGKELLQAGLSVETIKEILPESWSREAIKEIIPESWSRDTIKERLSDSLSLELVNDRLADSLAKSDDAAELATIGTCTKSESVADAALDEAGTELAAIEPRAKSESVADAALNTAAGTEPAAIEPRAKSESVTDAALDEADAELEASETRTMGEYSRGVQAEEKSE